MGQDDTAARKARAEQLRSKIAGMVHKPDKSPAAPNSPAGAEAELQNDDPTPSARKSPRDFINERMHELDQDENCPD
jgi:hypothetical protein